MPADSAVTWTSKSTSIARVSRDGLVTARKPGTATIVARTKRGRVTASITITVEPYEANSEYEPDEGLVVSDNVEAAADNTAAELMED